MTFLELCKQVRAEFGYSGTGPITVTNQTGQMALLVALVAKADLEVQLLWKDWRFLWAAFEFATVANQRDYSIANVAGWPADISHYDPHSFVLDAGTNTESPLESFPYQDYRDRRHQSTGTPGQVVIKPDNALVLTPTPNAIYTVSFDYWRRPARMTANADISPIPEQFHDIIVARAKMMLAESDGAADIFQIASGDYLNLLARLQAHSLPGHSQTGGFSQLDEPLVMTAD
jgi:hypothetical protein